MALGEGWARRSASRMASRSRAIFSLAKARTKVPTALWVATWSRSCRSMASANSPAVRQRSSGFSRSPRESTASSSGGTSRRIVASGRYAGRRVGCARSGGRQRRSARASQMVMAMENTSTRRSTRRLANCSGAM